VDTATEVSEGVLGRSGVPTSSLISLDASGALQALGTSWRGLSEAEGGGPPTQGDAESGLCFLGLVKTADPPRPEVTAAVEACHRAGIAIIMVIGDYGLTAEAVARRVGTIGTGPARVVTCAELDAVDDVALGSMLSKGEQLVFARVRPEHQMRIVAALERRGEVVAVAGDGVNDAPALKRASVGVAMGRGGTDVARAVAAMVLLDGSFASIAAVVELGRSVDQNVRQLLAYIFSHNLAELAPTLVAVFVGIPLVPLTALQVLSIDLGSDVLPGLALGTEKPEPGTMDRRSRPTGERLFSWPVVRRFLWEALTMAQADIIVSRFFDSFAVRSDRASGLRIGLLTNRPLLLAGCLDLGFAVAVSYVPALQSVFHTAPLRWSDWVVLVGFGALLLLADEVRKAGHRGAGPAPAPRAGVPHGGEV